MQPALRAPWNVEVTGRGRLAPAARRCARSALRAARSLGTLALAVAAVGRWLPHEACPDFIGGWHRSPGLRSTSRVTARAGNFDVNDRSQGYWQGLRTWRPRRDTTRRERASPWGRGPELRSGKQQLADEVEETGLTPYEKRALEWQNHQHTDYELWTWTGRDVNGTWRRAAMAKNPTGWRNDFKIQDPKLRKDLQQTVKFMGDVRGWGWFLEKDKIVKKKRDQRSEFTMTGTERKRSQRKPVNHFHLLDRYIRRVDALVPQEMENLVKPLKPRWGHEGEQTMQIDLTDHAFARQGLADDEELVITEQEVRDLCWPQDPSKVVTDYYPRRNGDRVPSIMVFFNSIGEAEDFHKRYRRSLYRPDKTWGRLGAIRCIYRKREQFNHVYERNSNPDHPEHLLFKTPSFSKLRDVWRAQALKKYEEERLAEAKKEEAAAAAGGDARGEEAADEAGEEAAAAAAAAAGEDADGAGETAGEAGGEAAAAAAAGGDGGGAEEASNGAGEEDAPDGAGDGSSGAGGEASGR